MAWDIGKNRTLWCTGWDDAEIHISNDVQFGEGFVRTSLVEGIGIHYSNEHEFIKSEINRFSELYGMGSLYDT